MFRLKRSITNPAYLDDYQQPAGLTAGSDATLRTAANEALAKMLALDKCEITKINPLFGSDLAYKCKVSEEPLEHGQKNVCFCSAWKSSC